MTEFLVIMVVALMAIAGATVIGPRLGIASPLVLMTLGVLASLLPAFSTVEIEPEWILAGVLPPLLYSSAVSMPAMNFRREFGAIGGLSVILVVGSALVLGVFFMLVIPDLGFAWGVALGAIVSPTDAVATSIIKRTSVSKRVVAILDGESLLNDATALVLLRTAIVATAASFSFWGAVGSFAYSVVVALVFGAIVGLGNLALRRRVTDPTVNTVISFTVPFLASVPAEALGASGLVAAVVAGLITGILAPRRLSPQNRLSDSQNWRTVELVLEGAVFLTMGIQITSILRDVEDDHAGIGPAVLIAVGALVLTVAVRAAYVAPLLGILARRAKRGEQMQARLQGMQQRLAAPDAGPEALREIAWGDDLDDRRDEHRHVGRDSGGKDGRRDDRHDERGARRDGGRGERRGGPGRGPSERQLDRFATRVRRVLADIDYFVREPLGWREGTAVVWAGMRGAVTVAAAQTLPDDTPQRSMLVLIAFAVAVLSLLVQGGTIGPLLRRISPDDDGAGAQEQAREESEQIMRVMQESAATVSAPPASSDSSADQPSQEAFESAKRYRLAVIAAQRTALLDARDDGTFDADVLAHALMNLDAAQIAIEMRGTPAGSEN